MIDKGSAIEKIRERLQRKDCSTGSWLQIPSSATAEIMAASGYDWLAVDLEHGSISISQLPDLFRSIELYDCLPFVRVASQSFDQLQSALDAGAAGLIIPNIKSVEEVIEIHSKCNWPPKGNRGVGFSRANMYGEKFELFKSFNQNIFLIGMIENKQAIEELPKILSKRLLDGILIGPYDLSASLGVTGETKNVSVERAVNRIKEICNEYNTPCGFHIVENKKEELTMKIREGFLLNAYSIDAIFLAKSARFTK